MKRDAGNLTGILAPLLLAVLVLGTARMVLSLLEFPREVVYLFSLTGIQVVGALYLPWRMGGEGHWGLRHLWLALLILFATSQAFPVAGLLYTYWREVPTLYHEVERLRNFLGYEPTILEHLWLHIQNWVLILPTLLCLVVGAPLLHLRRFLARRRDH